MILSRVCWVCAGAAATAVAGAVGKSEAVGDKMHNVAVRVVAAGLRVADAVSAATQSVADEANDVNAEAHRQARIDAAVEERLAALEKDIRAQVTAEVDGCAADSAE